MNNKNIILFIFLVNLTVPMAGMSTDIYLPSLPFMSEYFNSSNNVIQLSITLFAISFGLTQWIAGPISDAIGRHRPILLALLIQILSLIMIIFTDNIYVLNCARFVQGFGVGLMIVPTRAILSDILSGEQLKKHLTYITTSFSIGPIVAPFLGGYLQHYFSWQANFSFILIYLSILFLLYFFLFKETLTEKKKFSFNLLFHNTKTVFKSFSFVKSILLAGSVYSYVAIFSVVGPFYIQNILNKSAIFNGYIALSIGVFWFIGNLFSRILFHIEREKKEIIALMGTVIFAVVFLMIELLSNNFYFILLPLLLMVSFSGFVFPIAVSEGLSIFKNMSGTANGILFSFCWVSYGIFTGIGSLLKAHSLFPLTVLYLILSILILLLFFKIRHKK